MEYYKFETKITYNYEILDTPSAVNRFIDDWLIPLLRIPNSPDNIKPYTTHILKLNQIDVIYYQPKLKISNFNSIFQNDIRILSYVTKIIEPEEKIELNSNIVQFQKLDTTIILKPQLLPPDIRRFKSEYDKFLTSEFQTQLMNSVGRSESFVDIRDFGRRNLELPIGEYDTGYFLQFTYWQTPNIISELETKLRRDNRVLRFYLNKNKNNILKLNISPESEQDITAPDLQDILNSFGLQL
jgi:ribosomal protein S6